MSNNQFYFLAGLHRSGNTVLSSILNQNPNIYSSPLSPVLEYMRSTYDASNIVEQAVSNMYPERSIRLLSRMLENYYEDVDKPIIFDRDKNWAHPLNIKMLKECINFEPKIVFTTRPIIEILASFIALDSKLLIESMINRGFQINNNLPINDNLCDFLMVDYGPLSDKLQMLESIDNPDYCKMIHMVKYEDLLNSPQQTMDKIYDFIEIESFNHNFKNIRMIEKYNEAAAGLPKNIHKIRKSLGRSEVRVEDYLTPRSIEKYKDVRYF